MSLLPVCANPISRTYNTTAMTTAYQKAEVQRESILLAQNVSDGEQATHNIHWSDKLQRHQGQFQAMDTSVCCPPLSKLLVCIVFSLKQ